MTSPAARVYRAEHGHLDMPAHHRAPDGTWLGGWLRRCREMHRDGTLPEDRVA
ncbi:helicase associated domain-containing protein [Nocardia sp. R16R-3T]